jgi:transaldolase
VTIEQQLAVRGLPLLRLREAGASICLDTLSRDLLETGEFERLLRDFGVTGATSNPTIFAGRSRAQTAIPTRQKPPAQARDTQ